MTVSVIAALPVSHRGTPQQLDSSGTSLERGLQEREAESGAILGSRDTEGQRKDTLLPAVPKMQALPLPQSHPLVPQ